MCFWKKLVFELLNWVKLVVLCSVVVIIQYVRARIEQKVRGRNYSLFLAGWVGILIFPCPLTESYIIQCPWGEEEGALRKGEQRERGKQVSPKGNSCRMHSSSSWLRLVPIPKTARWPLVTLGPSRQWCCTFGILWSMSGIWNGGRGPGMSLQSVTCIRDRRWHSSTRQVGGQPQLEPGVLRRETEAGFLSCSLSQQNSPQHCRFWAKSYPTSCRPAYWRPDSLKVYCPVWLV